MQKKMFKIFTILFTFLIVFGIRQQKVDILAVYQS